MTGLRVGIAVSSTGARVVVLRGDRIVGTSESLLENSETPRTTIERALESLEHRGIVFGRSAVAVGALGPSAVQLREVSMNAGDRSAVIHDRVREEQTRLFAQRPNGTHVGPVEGSSTSGYHAVAYDADVVDELREVCHARGIHLRGIVPVVAILSMAIRSPAIEWVDGEVVAGVRFDPKGRLMSARRTRQNGQAPSSVHSQLIPSLATLGVNAWQFADAFAAARCGQTRRGPFELRTTEPRINRGVTIAGVACAAAIAAAIIAPVAADRRVAERATRNVQLIEASQRAAQQDEMILAGLLRTTNTIADFETHRRSMLLTLASLTRALPDSVFLTNLKLDATGGSLVAIAPRAAATLNELSHLKDVDAVALVGAVTPVSIEGERFERATVRLQWRGSQPQPVSKGAR